MALDGRTGSLLWRTYTLHEMFAVNCELDIDDDKTPDCLVAGRMAVISFKHHMKHWLK
jgi:hypothetical protein